MLTIARSFGSPRGGVAAALLAVLAACSFVSPPQARQQTIEAPAANTAAAALLSAERVEALFTDMPAGVDMARADTGAASADMLSRLKGVAQAAYAEELTQFREAEVLRGMLPDDPALTRAFVALATARNAAVQVGPSTPSRADELRARPDRHQLLALADAMAASRFARETALFTQRAAWALHQPGGKTAEVSERVADHIVASRQAEDAKPPTSVAADAGSPDRLTLLHALASLSPTDRATLERWYGSAGGKVARDRLVGSVQGANDRAGRAMLIDYLTAKTNS